MSDLRLLRDVIAWGRANGWTPRDRAPGDLTITWSTGPDVEIGVPGRYVGVGIPDGDFEPHWSVFTQSANEVFVTSVVQAVNLLVDLDVLPVEFHSAYAAGQAASITDGGQTGTLIRCPECGGLGRLLKVAERPGPGPDRYCDGNGCVFDGNGWLCDGRCPQPPTEEPERCPAWNHGPIGGQCAHPAGHADSHQIHIGAGLAVSWYGDSQPEPGSVEPHRILTAVERDAERYIPPVGVYGDGWTDPNAELLRAEGGEPL